MPRWLRWVGIAAGAVVALLVLALATVYVVSGRHLRRTHDIPPSTVRAATDSAAVARGQHLATAIGKCGDCHGADLGGDMMMDSPVFARLAAANITTGRGGLRDYTDADWERAIRHGVGQDGRPLVFMPAEAYYAMTDADLAALIAYLRTVQPVDRELPRPQVGPIARTLYLMGGFPLLPVELVDHSTRPADPEPGETAEYGEYLATIGGCRGCHGANLDGTGAPDTPDISPARLGAWTEADFFRALRQGVRPDGSVIDPGKMPWVSSGRMTDAEIRAVWLYVRSRVPAGTVQASRN